MRQYKDKCWLIVNLAQRQFLQRYQGSFLGMLWPLLAAGLQLTIYAFVFSVVLKAKWQQSGIEVGQEGLPFWLVMFSGMTLYFFCNELIASAPAMVTSVPNYVKKVKFPLAVLPIVNLLVAITTAGMFMLILAGAVAMVGNLHWWILLTPLVFLQAALWCLGFSWLLGAAGVFIRDLQHIVPFMLQLLLFATPIFYPPSAVPEHFQFVLRCNPLAFMVDTFRNLALWGVPPQWGPFAAWTAGSALCAYVGYRIFQRLRRAFADVM